MSYCHKCGAGLDASAKFCNFCGNPVAFEAQQPAEAYEKYQQNEFYIQQYGGYYGYVNEPIPNMGYPAEPVNHPTISDIFSKALTFLKSKPVKLWGISLLYSLLCVLVTVLGILPIITIPINLVLSIGMVSIFLDAYRGKDIYPEQLFIGFKNFMHFCGGMAWMMLWIFIWGLIPIVGVVFAVIKAYSYRFVPYILLNNPEITATDALRYSIKQTEGYRSRMFGADMIMIVCIAVVLLLFYILGHLPLMGIVFKFIFALIAFTVSIFTPLVLGVVQAAFYDEISKKNSEKIEQEE